jgi:hypothetical protein
VISEKVKAPSRGFKDDRREVPWAAIAERNVVVREYLRVDPEVMVGTSWTSRAAFARQSSGRPKSSRGSLGYVGRGPVLVAT